MRHDPWQLLPDRGFLMTPDPVSRLWDSANGFPLAASELAHAQAIADDLPELLRTRRIRTALESLPVVDLWPLHAQLDRVDFRFVERLMQIYSSFASAYIYATHELPAARLPEGVALPLVQLADMVERPPILSYANYTLSNWERIDPNAPITVENTRIIQGFLGTTNESWFIRIHVEIEAHAAEALDKIQQAVTTAALDDAGTLEAALSAAHESVCRMIETFGRMPEGCDADTYYTQVRPYMFGFNGVIYEGAFGNQPQSFRGQTAAQSSIIPALVAALGLHHETNGLTQHLEIMKTHMPKPHREFITAMHESGIRAAVLRHPENRALAEAYNECLRQILGFRRLHYHFATTYVANKVANPVGTGGTVFADWLQRLIDETAQQLV